MSKHGAGKNEPLVVVNICPDFCCVGSAVVPFDIFQNVSFEKSDYSPNCRAHGGALLRVNSVVAGTQGNMGTGFLSGVSLGDGHAVAMTGDPHVLVNGEPLVGEGDLAIMNTVP